jgi:DNA polymerase-3 subunit delta
MSSSSPSELPLVALVVGPETTLRDAALERLRELAIGGAPRDFNEDRFDLAAAGTDPRAILTACRTLPVMSEHRLVIVSGLADRKAGAFLEQRLLDYLEDPAPTTCLVLEGTRVDRRLKWVKRASALGSVIDCSGPSKPAELRDWIEARMSAAGKRAARGTAAALFDLVGADLDRLSFEIEKLCLYVGEADEVAPDDVATVTASLRPLAVYELTDAIGRRSNGDALRVLGRLRDQGEAPLAVLGALANHFRRLLRAYDCRPLEPRRVQQALSLHPFAARKLVEQAGRFDSIRVRRCLDEIRRTDEALKGALPLPPAMAIEQLVVRVSS